MPLSNVLLIFYVTDETIKRLQIRNRSGDRPCDDLPILFRLGFRKRACPD